MAPRRWALPAVTVLLAFGCVQIIGAQPGTLVGMGGGGGSTSTTSSGSAGMDGGSGGSTACTTGTCNTPGDCPVPPLCFSRGCNAGCCSLDPVPKNTVCATGYPAICDDMGNCKCY